MKLQRVGHDWATFTFTSLFTVCVYGVSLVAQLVNNLPAKQETLVWFLGLEVPLEKEYSSILGLSWWLRWQWICLQCGRPGFGPGLGRFPRGGHGNPLQYSCLENPHGQRSLVGYGPWGRKEVDTTEQPSIAQCVYVNSKLLIYRSLGILIYKNFPSNMAIRITKILKTCNINDKFLQAEVNLYCFKLVDWGFSHKRSK